ncbi:Flavin reductase-like, FMN-binding protein (fragment) [Cupriavidus taiwanensis]|uniref:Flavin reductase-like, FMN-binding protein n=1 Tax=Cupriavidus taiwanensis TaxID=164546 RepID=A0A375BH45_9BURK
MVERYDSDAWTQWQADGAPAPADAVVAMDFEVDELVERHGHFLIIGRVLEQLLVRRARRRSLRCAGPLLAQAHTRLGRHDRS